MSDSILPLTCMAKAVGICGNDPVASAIYFSFDIACPSPRGGAWGKSKRISLSVTSAISTLFMFGYFPISLNRTNG